jgi:hypothetical protein
MTNTAGLNFDSHLTAPGLRHGAFDHLEVAACFADLHGFHTDLFLFFLFRIR